MFKYLTGSLYLLGLLVFSADAIAEVRKWKDANGKTHYGDAPPMAGTAKVRTDKQTDDQIANGERIRSETENSARQDGMHEARNSAATSGKCTFQYFSFGDEHGKLLAAAASDECLKNEALRKVGKEDQVRLDDYNRWKDNYQMTSSRRSAAQSSAQNAEANRQLNNKLDNIRRTQKYGY